MHTPNRLGRLGVFPVQMLMITVLSSHFFRKNFMPMVLQCLSLFRSNKKLENRVIYRCVL